jgi:hypothetical protein
MSQKGNSAFDPVRTMFAELCIVDPMAIADA